jgi:hypothetical protein
LDNSLYQNHSRSKTRAARAQKEDVAYMKSPKFFSRRALAVAMATCFAAMGFTAVATTLTTGTAVAANNTYHLTDTDNALGIFKQGGTPAITLTASLLTGTAETMQPTVTDTFPTGVVPTPPTGTTPWNCGTSSGQTVTCAYTGVTLTPTASYPTIVLGIAVFASATAGPTSDAAAVSSADATTPVLANDSFTVELLPAAPTITSVTGGGTEARVVFTNPTNNSGSAITGYVITPYIGGSVQGAQVFNTAATTQMVTGLTAGDTYTFKVAATNGVGNSVNSAASGTATVNAAASVTTSTLPGGDVGVAYSQTLVGTGGAPTYSWTETGALPSGITLSTGGLLAGTTTAAANTYPIVVTLTDSLGQTATKSLTLNIVADPTVTTASLPGGNLTVAYNQTLTGSGGTLPYTWAETGALPNGLTLSSAGVLSGTPTETGTFPVTVTLTDSLAKTATMALSLVIGTVPVVTSPSPTTTVPVTVPVTPVPVAVPTPAPIPTTTTVPVVVAVATGGSTAETPGGLGYWSLTPSGQLSEHGNAGNFGSENNLPHNSPIVGISSTNNGQGYWLVSANGGVFTFGDATFHGSLGAKHINTPIVGIVGSPNGGGYLLVSSDGGVFAFGDASFQGSLGNKHLNQPIVGVVPSSNGMGYMLLGADGGVFAFGDTSFEGSLGAGANKHIVAMALSPSGKGYWLVGKGGTVYSFGNSTSFGSVPAKSGDKIVGIIANGDAGYRLITASGKSIAFGTVPAS